MEEQKKENKYEETLGRLIAIMGGEEHLLPQKKMPADLLSGVIESLLKEDKEKIVEEVKTGIKDLLNKHVEYKKQKKAKEEELKKLDTEKQKEFVEAANKLFNKIDNIGKLEQSYKDSLKEATEQK